MKTQAFFLSALAVASGAVIGALMRWGISEWLNPKTPLLPLGTLICNWAGAFFIGFFLAWITATSASPVVRLFLVTGLLGALSTLSSFSAESVGLLSSGLYFQAFVHIMLHLCGSIMLTFFGFYLGRFFY